MLPGETGHETMINNGDCSVFGDKKYLTTRLRIRLYLGKWTPMF